jgi:hypothetical protein
MTKHQNVELSWLSQKIAQGRKEPFTEIVNITPTIATWLLERNDDNRSIRQIEISKMAHDLKAGQFDFNGESIIVSKDGRLNDGQHRLWAVLEADTPMKSVMVFGIERHTRMTVDNGVPRMSRDFLSMAKVKNASWIATASLLYTHYVNGYYAYSMKYSKEKALTKSDLLRTYEKDQKLFDQGAAYVQTDRVLRKMIPSQLIAAYVILHKVNYEAAQQFFSMLATGANLPKGSPILLLRTKLMGTDKLRSTTRLELILRSWSAWRGGAILTRAPHIMGSYPKVLA